MKIEPGQCKVEGCESPVRTRGLCSAHYQRERRYGDPNYNPRQTQKVEAQTEADRQLVEFLQKQSLAQRQLILNQMTPEARANTRALLGLKEEKPWEQLEISRATYYRMRQMWDRAIQQGLEFNEVFDKSLDNRAKLRKELGMGPINKPNPQKLADEFFATLESLTDGQLINLLVRELGRRIGQDLTLNEVIGLLTVISEELSRETTN